MHISWPQFIGHHNTDNLHAGAALRADCHYLSILPGLLDINRMINIAIRLQGHKAK